MNLKFVCFGSQRGYSNHVQIQCQLNKRVVLRYCATIKSVEWVRSCKDWVFLMYILIFIFRLPLVNHSVWDIFRHLQTNSPETCREVVLHVLRTDVQYVISFFGWKSGQQEEGYYARKLFWAQTRGIKTSDYCYHINRRIRLTLPPNSNDDSFAGYNCSVRFSYPHAISCVWQIAQL